MTYYNKGFAPRENPCPFVSPAYLYIPTPTTYYMKGQYGKHNCQCGCDNGSPCYYGLDRDRLCPYGKTCNCHNCFSNKPCSCRGECRASSKKTACASRSDDLWSGPSQQAAKGVACQCGGECKCSPNYNYPSARSPLYYPWRYRSSPAPPFNFYSAFGKIHD